MKEFVVGFAFNMAKTKVLLIRKNRPEFQKGFLNGVGGGINPGESPAEAMVREFKEETDLDVPDWKYFCLLNIPKTQSHYDEEVKLWCFGTYTDKIWQAKSMTDEGVELFPIVVMSDQLLPNLHWLIPMFLKDDETYSVTEL